MKKIFAILFSFTVLASCTGNDKFVLRSSIGKLNKVMVVTKSSDWNGDLGKEVRNTFGELVVGLPQPEPISTVSQIAPNGFGQMMKVSRNILIIGESDKESFSVKRNVYAQPQTIVYIYAKDDAGMLEIFKKHKNEILAIFEQSDINMTQGIFAKSKLDDSKFKTLQNLGVSFTIHDKFNTVDDTGDFLWLRHHLTSGIAKTGSNNILVYSVPLEDETTVSDSIVAVRNKIGKKYIPGSDPEKMYMITEKAYTPFTFDTKIDGKSNHFQF